MSAPSLNLFAHCASVCRAKRWTDLGRAPRRPWLSAAPEALVLSPLEEFVLPLGRGSSPLGKRYWEQELRAKATVSPAAEAGLLRLFRFRRPLSPLPLPADAVLAPPTRAWLDEREASRPLTRADLHSQNDETAAHVVAAGGGMQAVIDATGLHTRENVLGLIDPGILAHAFDNDALAHLLPPPVES
jgi:hypothetical protein